MAVGAAVSAIAAPCTLLVNARPLTATIIMPSIMAVGAAVSAIAAPCTLLVLAPVVIVIVIIARVAVARNLLHRMQARRAHLQQTRALRQIPRQSPFLPQPRRRCCWWRWRCRLRALATPHAPLLSLQWMHSTVSHRSPTSARTISARRRAALILFVVVVVLGKAEVQLRRRGLGARRGEARHHVVVRLGPLTPVLIALAAVARRPSIAVTVAIATAVGCRN